jgi:hypothetical protein
MQATVAEGDPRHCTLCLARHQGITPVQAAVSYEPVLYAIALEQPALKMWQVEEAARAKGWRPEGRK